MRSRLMLTCCSLQFVALFVPTHVAGSEKAMNAADQHISTGADPETGLRFWEWNKYGFNLRLTQRLPDQTRGFFEARGFDLPSREIIATSCVFQTMVKNSGANPEHIITADLGNWEIHSGDNTSSLLVREYWEETWKSRKTPQPARIAFNWSFLPTQIRYHANDYNWGMTSYGLAPGTHFDLVFKWEINGKPYQGRIEDIICPDDVHPQPNAH